MCWRESWGRCILFQRGRRLRPGGKKVPRAFWTPSFVGLAMAEVPEGAEAAAAAARLHGTRVWQLWLCSLLELNT